MLFCSPVTFYTLLRMFLCVFLRGLPSFRCFGHLQPLFRLLCRHEVVRRINVRAEDLSGDLRKELRHSLPPCPTRFHSSSPLERQAPMMQSQRQPKPEDTRSRYCRILRNMQEQNAFTLSGLLSVCEDIAPKAVNKIVDQLCREGWLFRQKQIKEDQSELVWLHWQRDHESFPLDTWVDNQVFGNQITKSPEEERPRERLMRLGAEQLRTAELLAILIRTGRTGESALQAGERIANRFAEHLERLAESGLRELKEISPAVSEPAYCQIMAGIELGRRVAVELERRNQNKIRIVSADTAAEYCRRLFQRLAVDGRQEEFHIVTLDTKNQPITSHRITVGTLDASLVHPREVFRQAIRDAASSVILVHNHPSGDPTPSREDLQVTRQLERAGELIGIRVIDHIVVGDDRALSIRQWEQSQ